MHTIINLHLPHNNTQEQAIIHIFIVVLLLHPHLWIMVMLSTTTYTSRTCNQEHLTHTVLHPIMMSTTIHQHLFHWHHHHNSNQDSHDHHHPPPQTNLINIPNISTIDPMLIAVYLQHLNAHVTLHTTSSSMHVVPAVVSTASVASAAEQGQTSDF